VRRYRRPRRISHRPTDANRRTFSEAGFNLVESAANLREFVAAPHECWAELAKRMHNTKHAGDDTTKGETS